MRKLVILILAAAAIAATAYAAATSGLIGHSGLVRGDIGEWVHEQVQVSILAPIAQLRLHALSPRPQTEKDAPAVTAWQVVSAVRSVISFLVQAFQLVMFVRAWRRGQPSESQILTLLARFRSAFLDRARCHRVGSIVS